MQESADHKIPSYDPLEMRRFLSPFSSAVATSNSACSEPNKMHPASHHTKYPAPRALRARSHPARDAGGLSPPGYSPVASMGEDRAVAHRLVPPRIGFCSATAHVRARHGFATPMSCTLRVFHTHYCSTQRRPRAKRRQRGALNSVHRGPWSWGCNDVA